MKAFRAQNQRRARLGVSVVILVWSLVMLTLLWKNGNDKLVVDGSIGEGGSLVVEGSTLAGAPTSSQQQAGVKTASTEEEEWYYTDKWTNRMMDRGMERSLVQHQHYHTKKTQLHSIHNKSAIPLYHYYSQRYAAFRLNKHFCFRHIFKNGGTSVEIQTHSKQLGYATAKQCQKWLVTVRDPLDHFFSGWRECANRFYEQMKPDHFIAKEGINGEAEAYDARVRFWLEHTKQFGMQGNSLCLQKHYPLSFNACKCAAHSLGQANYLLIGDDHDNRGVTKLRTVPNVAVVGDLRELGDLLQLVGFDYDPSISSGRDSSLYQHSDEFRKHLDLLSPETVRDLCRFLALDYFLFSFQMPAVCADLSLDASDGGGAGGV